MKKNPDGTFLNEEQMVVDILINMPYKERESLKDMDRSELILLHPTIGQAIRNAYGLWDASNPHTYLDDSFADNYPDQVSQRVIENLYTAVQAEWEMYENVQT